MIEFAISLTGLVMFIYVFLKTWGWLGGMIVQRQSHFQATRVQAGKVGSPGVDVGFARPPLQLVGNAGSVGSVLFGLPAIPRLAPPCVAAVPFFDQAQTHFDQAALYQQQVLPVLEQMRALSEEATTIQARLDEIDAILATLDPLIASCTPPGGGGEEADNTP